MKQILIFIKNCNFNSLLRVITYKERILKGDLF